MVSRYKNSNEYTSESNICCSPKNNTSIKAQSLPHYVQLHCMHMKQQCIVYQLLTTVLHVRLWLYMLSNQCHANTNSHDLTHPFIGVISHLTSLALLSPHPVKK